MQASSRINREEQLQVVVRLKPEQGQSRYSKSVYLSNQDENQLVVQTDSKKQIFMFDHIAHQLTSQLQIYHMIGQECVQQALQGYNCCIFAYGQTGAGKSYSVLGNQNDLITDPYCQSRGVLPRVLEDIFETIANGEEAGKTTVMCSYIEIYNEQIFDLLSSDKRIHQIREDAKKGVFVQGLLLHRINNYKNALALLLEGEKTRKMASTSMNTQSSRSHAVFSILIECETVQEQIIKTKKAKLNIVDLAGSERVKHTNSQGQRLREGCNINKSLHVLCNVINSLAESSKKKRHIPFRDSKLTHFLKDSLGGNSITKLLANIHTSRQYFGDTLSTLMFAKRAKSVKMKAELNETSTENFDALRKEVRRLREQLAQTRYFKADGRMSERSLEVQNQMVLERTSTQPNDILEVGVKSEILKTLQQNEVHYKSLMEIYEEHMKTCLSSSNFQRRQNINIVRQWKNLERRNISLTHIVKQLPSFTKIYKQNLLLRQQRTLKVCSEEKEQTVKDISESGIDQSNKEPSTIKREALDLVIDHYERLISEMQERFKQSLQTIEKNFYQLENESRIKDKKIKDLKKRWNFPPEIQELKNQNQYLHLNILNLQDQIRRHQQNQQRMKIQLKQSKKSTAKKIQSKQSLAEEEDDFIMIFDKVQEIKHQAEKQAAEHDLERAEMQMVIGKLQAEINRYMAENNRLKDKYSHKSKSRRHKNSKKQFEEVQSLSHSKSKPNIFSSPTEKQMFRSEIKYLKNEAVSMISGNDDFKTQQHNYTKQILMLKMEIKRRQKQIIDVKKQLQEYAAGDKKIEDQFGKTLDQIIEEYRHISGRRTLLQSKSVKVFQRIQEEKTVTKMSQSGKRQPPKRPTNFK